MRVTTTVGAALVFSGWAVWNSATGQTVELAYGMGRFYNESEIQNQITFSETPQFAFQTTNPGGDGVSTYYDKFVYSDVGIETVSWNSNKPGQRRLSDIAHSATADFYSVGSGNLLVPGLGAIVGGLGGDDGVLLDFTDIGGPINAVGLNFGSVQSTSPCCVRQLFSFELSTGTVYDILFSNADYHGRSTELSHSTFVGFHAQDASILRLRIEQFGHNAILDNLTWGTTRPEVTPGTPHIILNFPSTPVEAPPNEKIELVSPVDDATRKLISNMKPNWREDADRNRKASEIASIPAAGLGSLAGFYANAIKNFTAFNAAILDLYADDPPRFDYETVAVYEGNESTQGFVSQFGAPLEPVDEMFLQWEYALAHMELALTSLERLQGAVIDDDAAAIDRQGTALVHFLSEADFAFAAISLRFDDIRSILEDSGVQDSLIIHPLHGETTFYELHAVVGRLLLEGRTIINLQGASQFVSDFVSCLNGPSNTASLECSILHDSTGDRDVDLSDFAAFQSRFSN